MQNSWKEQEKSNKILAGIIMRIGADNSRNKNIKLLINSQYTLSLYKCSKIIRLAKFFLEMSVDA